MKKLILILFLLPLMAFAQHQQTYFTPGVPPSSTSFTPTFRFLGTDSLAKYYLNNSNRWSQVYTAAQINALLAGVSGVNIYNSDGTLTGDRNVDLATHVLGFTADGTDGGHNYMDFSKGGGLNVITNSSDLIDQANLQVSSGLAGLITSTAVGARLIESGFLVDGDLQYTRLQVIKTLSGVTTNKWLRLDTSKTVYLDQIHHKAIEYSSVDTANYIDSSLITKKWVLNRIHNFGLGSFLPLTFTTNNNVNQGIHSLIFHAANGADSTHVVIDTGQFDASSTDGVLVGEIGQEPSGTFAGVNELSSGNGGFFSTNSIPGGVTGATMEAVLSGGSGGKKSIQTPVGSGSDAGIPVADEITHVGLIGTQVYPLSGDAKQYAQYGKVDSLIAAAGGGTTTHPLTMNNSGSGATSGSTFDGSAAKTISYNTIGASPLAGSSSIVTIGTLSAGSIPYSLLTGTPSALPPNGAAGGELAGSYPNPTLLNSAVIGKVLTGYTSGAGTVASTDNILQAIQKLNGNIVAIGTPVTAVTGTTNRITSSGGTTPDIDISATFEALLGKVANPLSQFSSTTSAQLAGVLSDESGSGLAVFNNSPTLITPALGTPSALVLTNATGLPNAGLNNSSVTVNGTSIALGASGTVTAAAGTLTGTTLNSTVVTSSLTSVGTLSAGSIPYSLVTGGPTAFTAGRGILIPSTAIILDTTQNYTWLKAQTVTKNGIATTTTNGFNLLNTTASLTSGATRQFSPAIHLQGHVTTGSVDNITDWTIDDEPITAGVLPVMTWKSYVGTTALASVATEMTLTRSSGLNVTNAITSGTTVQGAIVQSTGKVQTATQFLSNGTGNTAGMYMNGSVDYFTVTSLANDGLLGFTAGVVGSAPTTVMKWSNNSTISLVTAPTTSASTYDFLTRNTSTGVVEKIGSASIPTTQATADLTAQSAAGNVTTFTVGSSTATFNVSTYINVTAVSVDVIQGQITYTDENNTAQTVSLANISAIGNSTYSPITIRAKNATVITVKTNLTTGAGTITFDTGARITQL